MPSNIYIFFFQIYGVQKSMIGRLPHGSPRQGLIKKRTNKILKGALHKRLKFNMSLVFE